MLKSEDIELTPEEETKLKNYFQELNIPETQQEPIRTILKMSIDKVSIKDIRAEVRSSFDFVGEHRMKLRRRGVW
jgi:hypothetical protein